MLIRNIVIIFFTLVIQKIYSDSNNIFSKNYITGDNFRSLCNHFYEKINWHYHDINSPLKPFDATKIKKGDFIFIDTAYLNKFFAEVDTKIKTKYFIITHHSDGCAPSGAPGYPTAGDPEKALKNINNDNIIAWFGICPDIVNHPKFIPIPMGIRYINEDYIFKTFDEVIELNSKKMPIKKNLLYMNFFYKANKLRYDIHNFFSNFSFVINACFEKKQLKDYLIDISESKFVLSPQGWGLDCHRTWEILLMGSIPVVKTSSMDQLYVDLPVLIINEWPEITQDFLEKKYLKIISRKYNFKKIYMSYWKERIKNISQKYLKALN